MRELVLTLIGTDRPGLVQSVARMVADHGGSWVESRMAHLAGQFAGILSVHVPSGRAEALVEALRDLGDEGLSVTVAAEPEAGGVSGAGRTIVFELTGQDRPGIVAQVSRLLAARDVNVEEFNTRCASAPMSGETLFTISAKLSLPDGLTTEDLRADFEAAADDLMVDVSFDDAG